jgi:hypothetical protein
VLLNHPLGHLPDQPHQASTIRSLGTIEARNHIRAIERLGYKVTIEPLDPETGELITRTAS